MSMFNSESEPVQQTVQVHIAEFFDDVMIIINHIYSKVVALKNHSSQWLYDKKHGYDLVRINRELPTSVRTAGSLPLKRFVNHPREVVNDALEGAASTPLWVDVEWTPIDEGDEIRGILIKKHGVV